MANQISFSTLPASDYFTVKASGEWGQGNSKEIMERDFKSSLISSNNNSDGMPDSLQMKLAMFMELRGENTKQMKNVFKQNSKNVSDNPTTSQTLTLSDEWKIPMKAAVGELEEMSMEKESDSGNYRENWQKDLEQMKTVIEDYLNPYEYAVPKFTSFWSDFADFTSKMTDYYTVSTDKNGIQTIQFKDTFAKDLDALIAKYKNGPEGVLYPESGAVSKEVAEEWATRFGMDPSCVKAQGGGYVVRVDIRPLEAIRASATTDVMAMVQFDSWNIGFNLQKDKYQTAAQTLTTKYSSATQIVDNEFRRISASITADAEHLKNLMSL